ASRQPEMPPCAGVDSHGRARLAEVIARQNRCEFWPQGYITRWVSGSRQAVLFPFCACEPTVADSDSLARTELPISTLLLLLRSAAMRLIFHRLLLSLTLLLAALVSQPVR